MINVGNVKKGLVKACSISSVERSLVVPTSDFLYAPLAIVACHFNWGGSNRPVQNLLRFVREQENTMGLPVFGIEAVMPGCEPVMKSHPRWRVVDVPERARLWQKEALLNEAARLVPSSFDYIAALDADVWISNDDWAAQSVMELQGASRVVQPFGEAVWTNEKGQADLVRQSSAKAGLDRSWHGHPGFGWVFDRDFFDKVGFYQFAALGTGDIVTAAGLLDDTLPSTCKTSIGIRNLESGLFDEWRRRALDYMAGGKPGFVEGSIWHEWHGTRNNRNYADRSNIMRDCDVLRDIRQTAGGWLEWTDNADPRMVAAVYKHFTDRKEDGE